MPIPTLQIKNDELLVAALSAMGSDAAQSTLHAKARFVDSLIVILKGKKP